MAFVSWPMLIFQLLFMIFLMVMNTGHIYDHYVNVYAPLIEIEILKQNELQKDDSRLSQYLKYFDDGDEHLSDQLQIKKIKESEDSQLERMKQWDDNQMSVADRLRAFSFVSSYDLYMNEDFFDFKLVAIFLGMVLISNVIFFKLMYELLIEWDPIEGTSSHDEYKKDQQKFLLLNNFVQNQRIHVLFWYWFIDAPGLVPTYIEFVVIFIHLTFQSFTMATIKTCQNYIQ